LRIPKERFQKEILPKLSAVFGIDLQMLEMEFNSEKNSLYFI
jgi:hypothetical protein